MRLAIFIALVVVVWCSSKPLCEEPGGSGSAGRGDLLMGDIPLHDTTDKNRDINHMASIEVEAWGKALLAAVSAPAGGVAPQELGNDGAGYLAALYLLCTSKRGPCGFVLESILEADLLASKQTAAAHCTVMNRFWKVWLANEGDRRLQFKVPIGHAPGLAKFNTSDRPRFVRCKETVEGLLADSKALTQRYGPDSATAKAASSLNAILAEVRKGNIDLFATTGMTPAG
jgi:hypothetical protein